MIYLYCRISQKKQNIERQKRNLKEVYPDGIFIEEAYTGTETAARPEWAKLCKAVRPGDTIAFDSVSRMSRNADEGMQAYEALYEKGVNLVFLKEPQINTDTYKKALNTSISMTGTNVDFILEGINKFLLALAREQIALAFEQSEKEVMDLRQRTKEGVDTARRNGKRIGTQSGDTWETKKAKEAKKQILKLSKDFGGTNTVKEICAICKIDPHSYYKYKAQLKAAIAAKAEEEERAILEAD